MSGGKDDQMKEMVIQSIRSMEKYLIARPKGHPEIALLADLNGETQTPKMDELVKKGSLRCCCFFFGLGFFVN